MIRHILAGGLAMLAAQAADAAVVTVSGSFTATDWEVYFGSPSAPIDPLYLSYEVTFDDAQDYDADTSVLTLLSTNIPYDISFSYSSGNGVFILATHGTATTCSHLSYSFCAFVNNFSTGTPFFAEQSPDSGGWVAQTITSGLPAVVPEPASWALMIAGFGLMGAALRRRTTATA